ncbi:MAG TPA: hypothetical protein VL651_08195 [Bacteroidia bacterium]|nr:hypothetical protein [Bacteroidia bacterium]
MKKIISSCLFAIFLGASFSVAGQSYHGDPKAKLLCDSVTKLLSKTRERAHDSLFDASIMNLLEQATASDTDYYPAYEEVINYQIEYRQYQGALSTAKEMARLKSGSAENLARLGLLYDVNNDSVHAHLCYQSAVRIYDVMLDTVKVKDRSVLQIEVWRALVLILLGNESEGRNDLDHLYNEASEGSFKQSLEKYLHAGRKDVIAIFLKTS